MIGKDFILAGNAIFTVREGDEHLTYRIKKPTHEKGRKLSLSERNNKPYFIGKLVGPDNTSDYRYLGVLNENTFEVNLTGKSMYTKSSKAVQVLELALGAIRENDMSILSPNMEILAPKYCGRCARLLTVPESIENGIGPECFTKMGGVFAKELGLDFNSLVKEASGK